MKRLALIGFPLTHSFSQKYFTDKFKREAISGYSYQLFPLHFISELPLLLSAYPDLVGINVTIPYKELVMPFMDELDESAREAGAVNTIRIQRNHPEKGYHLTGYNTDTYGFRESIRPILRNNHQRAFILGTGGAAKAVASVLRSLNIEYLFVSRKEGKKTITYNDMNQQAVQSFPFIINCTPIGTYPNTDDCPDIPYQFLTAQNFLYDLVYNPEETLFLRKGREQGAMVKNGLDMLHLQADKAWEIFSVQ